MKILNVNASKNYQIVINNSFDNLLESIKNYNLIDKILIVTDSNVESLYFGEVEAILNEKPTYKFVIEAGEHSKSQENYFDILNFLAENNFSRKSLIVGLGGGVVGDLASFVASTYLRGVSYVAIPTSLLSMVDSSVGGKTAINLKSGKNLVGTFFQPDSVYINLTCLKTLPEREVISGTGEIMKYAFIDERISPQDIENKDYEALVYNSLLIKRDIVEKDEKESGDRMLLNFGHTIGHSLEKLYDYSLSHGECVIRGMKYSIDLSKKFGFISQNDYENALKFLLSSNVSFDTKFTMEEILKVVKNDKKASGDSVNFVFTKGFGKAFVEKIKISEIQNG